MLIPKLDGNVVVSLLGRRVLHGGRAVLVVVARHDGLARALDGQSEAAGAGVLRLDRELVGLVDDAALEAVPVGLDPGGVAAVDGGHGEGRVGQVLAVVFEVNLVIALLLGNVADL